MILSIQGCESDIDSVLQESSSRIKDGIYSVCKLTGELALATDTHMLYFEEAQTDRETQMVKWNCINLKDVQLLEINKI